MKSKAFFICSIILVTSLAAFDSDARVVRRYHVRENNELSGGIGFAADLTTFTPGGFKWFNEYGRYISGPTWLNIQLNVVVGNGTDCHYNQPDNTWICYDDSFDGNSLELAGGIKLKWRTRRIPLQIHAKFGGAINFIWFESFYGTSIALRGGVGVRYFFIPTFSVGVELVNAIGPAFIRYGYGAELYAALDFNFGVEWRF